MRSSVVGVLVFLGVVAAGFLAYHWGSRRNSRAADARPVASVNARAPEPAFSPPVVARGRNGAGYFLPPDCAPSEFDAVLHFHAAEPTLRSAVEAAGLRAAVFVSNQGTSSDAYRDATRAEGTLERVLSALEAELARHCGGPRRIARVALSSWSAGFAAVQQLLRTESQRARVDAVLLADSLHAAFLDPKTRSMGATQLQGFVDFARVAARGEKLMLITHSSIQTEGYASTTETADFLLRALGLTRVPSESGSTAKQGNFAVYASPGMDEQAHVKELKAFGTLLFPALEQRWGAERARRPR